MSLVSSSLPSLANGVSQQPATARLSSQGETQENGYSSIVEGNSKRPPTHHIAKIINGTINSAFSHIINRDTTERYEVVVTNNNIRVFDLDGNEKTVTVSGLAEDDTYLQAVDPATAFRAVTIADYTFLANRELEVKIAKTATSFQVSVAEGAANAEVGSTISVKIRTGNLVSVGSYTVLNTDTLANVYTALNTALVAALTADGVQASYNTTAAATYLEVVHASGADFGYDVYADTATETGRISYVGSQKRATKFLPGVVYVKQGNYGTTYTLTINGASNTAYTFTHTTSNTDVTGIDTKNIASALYNGIVALTSFNTDFTTTLSGSLIKFVPKFTGTWALTAADGNGNKNLIAIKDSIQKFTDLPPKCFSGFAVKIIGDVAANEDDYYVTFNTQSATSLAADGQWIESGSPYTDNDFDATTMPHQLVRQADDTFVFQPATWDSREAGDATSNPEPSIVGTTLNDIAFFRNRLTFLADESVVASAVGPNYFRFWRITVTAILDGDPIDVAASNVSVSILRNFVPYSQDKALLFSDQKQFIFSGGDLLTPKTASIKPSTAFESLIDCKPVAAGKSVYFPTPRGDNSGLREYSTDQTTATDDAVDVTAHVPAYIPANVFKITTCGNEDVLFLLTRDDPTSIYVYKYYFVGSDKLQASWSKWTCAGDILDANFIETDCYLLIQREDGVYLEKVSIEAFRNDTNMDYEILLDRRFTAGPSGLVTGSYDANTNLTTFALPYETDETVQAVVRDNGTIPSPYFDSQMLAVTKLNTNTSITIAGDVHLVPLVIGVQYTYLYEFSEITLKQAAGQGGERPLTGGRLQIRLLDLVYDRTGYFRAVVTPTYGSTYTYQVTPKILGQYVTGAFALDGGNVKVPVLAESDKVTIQVINDSPYPSHLLSATWLGEFILKGRRM